MNLFDITQKLKNKEPFAFSRFGDGEWLNIRKVPGQNCDNNIYYADLGDRLKKIVEVKQDYYLGAQDYKKFKLLSDVKQYPANNWLDADIFHKASMEGKLQPLFDTLNEVDTIYIGNQSLSKLGFINEFIEIPYSNVWLQYNKVFEQIKNTFTDEHRTYLFSAGMCANVFIHDLWNSNKNNTYIDVGSVFDPYIGRNTRSYHKTLKL